MFPIPPITTPCPFDELNAGSRPHRPATRMDVERHRLEDKRANYLRMDIDAHMLGARCDRESHLMATPRTIRDSVANMLVAAGEYIRREPPAQPGPIPFQEPAAESTDTAVNA